MSDTNGLPEWLRELGDRVDRLVREGERTDQRINGLVQAINEQHVMLGEIILALGHQIEINDEHRRELDRLEAKTK